MRWKEVITEIKTQQGEQVNFDELNLSSKCDILRSNPETAMCMFDKQRFDPVTCTTSWQSHRILLPVGISAPREHQNSSFQK